jgi:hypothetical protein
MLGMGDVRRPSSHTIASDKRPCSLTVKTDLNIWGQMRCLFDVARDIRNSLARRPVLYIFFRLNHASQKEPYQVNFFR